MSHTNQIEKNWKRRNNLRWHTLGNQLPCPRRWKAKLPSGMLSKKDFLPFDKIFLSLLKFLFWAYLCPKNRRHSIQEESSPLLSGDRLSRKRFTSDCLSSIQRDESNLAQLADSYKNILVSIGENPEREGLLDTPTRAAKAMLTFTQVMSSPYFNQTWVN